MKKILFLFIALFINVYIIGQSVLVSPTTDGGFENGTNFTLNGWKSVSSLKNRFYVGTAPGASDSTNCAFTGKNSSLWDGEAFANINHFYRKIIFNNETNLSISFKYKINNPDPYIDYLQVHLVSCSTGIVAGSQLYSGQIGSDYDDALSWTTITLPSIDASMFTDSARLVFSWITDGVAPDAAVAIDYIEVIAQAPPSQQLTGIKTIKTSGGDYSSFTDAVNALNTFGVGNGGVTFNVDAGFVSTEDVPVITATGTALNPIKFQKSGIGANPLIIATGGSGTFDAGITISGGDYFTFDGIDISVSGTDVENGYLIKNASNIDGAWYDTIRNCKIILNKANNLSKGILQSASGNYGGGFVPISSLGANSYNAFKNIIIENSYYGIHFYNGNPAYHDQDNRIESCTIGASSLNDIGGSGPCWGIRIYNQSNLKVFGNEVRNIFTTGSNNVSGIYVDYGYGVCEVFNNKVHDISTSSTSTSAVVYGIRTDIASSDTGYIYNNIIYGLSHNAGTANSTVICRALAVNVAGTGTANVYYNSVRIEITNAAASNTAFHSGGGTVNVKNNIFANFSVTDITSKRYCWYNSATVYSSSNNILYIDETGTNNFVGHNDTLDCASLQLFAAAISPAAPADGNEAGSANFNPNFSSVTNLTFGGATPAANSGTPVNHVLTDYAGTIRDVSRPDIGAYETSQAQLDKSAPVLSNVIIASGFFPSVKVTVTDNSTSANNATIRLWYRLGSTGTFTVIDADSKPSGSMNGIYTWNTSIAALSGGNYEFFISARDEQGAGKGIWTNPIWATNYTGFSVSDPPNYLLNPDTAANKRTFTKASTFFGGTYTIGASGNFTNLTAATTALNGQVISAPIIFELLSDYVSTGETFPIVFDEIYNVNATNTITLKPQAGVTATISGSSPTAIIHIYGTDYFTIDGSNNGTNSRNLTITNTSISTSAAIWIASKGANFGATNNTIKNCIISCGVAQNSINAYTYGIIATGTTLSLTPGGADNDNNSYINNYIYKVRYAISSIGISSSNPNQNTSVINNLLGPTAFGTDEIGKCGILMHNNYVATIKNNEIRFVGGNYSNTIIGTDRIGIALASDADWPPSNTFASNITITNNKIHDIVEERSSSAAAIILAASDGANNTNNLIANNMICNIRSNGTTSNQTVGIGIYNGNKDKVFFNTISLTGDLDPNSITATTNSSFGLYVNTYPENLTLKDNIVYVDLNSNTTTVNHYAIYLPSSYNWGIGGINYNNYFINDTTPNMSFAKVGTTSYPDLQAYKAVSGGDIKSISYLPVFVSPSNIHLLANAGTGTPINEIIEDIDGEPRNSLYPYMGADEGPSAPTITVQNNCSSSVLTAGNYTGTLLWNTGETTSSITVTSTGTYTVTQTINGCASAAATGAAVPETPKPVVTVVDNCGNSTLTAGDITGNLLWSTGETTTSITVTNAGTYTIIQTGNGCTSDTGIGIANPKTIPPAPIANSPLIYCQNVTPNPLTATGTELLWYTAPTGGTGNATAPIPSTATVGTTSFYVSQTVNGCESSRSVINVVINAAPNANAGNDFGTCVGSSITLTATGGNTYLWNNGVTQGVPFVPPSTNTYIVTAYTGSCTDTDTITITVSTVPPTPVISLNGIYLISSATSGNQWYNNSGLIPGAITQSITPTVSGNYYVIVTNGGCPSDTSNVINVVISGISNSTLNYEYLNIYPNPINGNITFEYDSKNSENINLKIQNILGQIIFNDFKNTIQGKNKIIYDFTYLNTGIYYFIVESESKTYIKKFIVQKP